MKLSQLAKTPPQNESSCMTSSVQEKLSSMYKTTLNMMEMFCETESNLKNKAILALVGQRLIFDGFRDLLSLSLKIGGLKIRKTTEQIRGNFMV